MTPEDPGTNVVKIAPTPRGKTKELESSKPSKVIYTRPYYPSERDNSDLGCNPKERILAAMQLQKAHQLNPRLRTSGVAASTNNPFGDIKEKSFTPAVQLYRTGVEGADWKQSATFDNIASIQELRDELNSLELPALEDLGALDEFHQILSLLEKPKEKRADITGPMEDDDLPLTYPEGAASTPVSCRKSSTNLPYAIGDAYITPEGGAVMIKDPTSGAISPYPLVHNGNDSYTQGSKGTLERKLLKH